MSTNSYLESTYQNIKTKYGNNWELEPFSIVKTVNDHREYWKPKNVNIILLAESHVYTTVSDHNITMNYDDFTQLNGCPRNYVRLVYCLGYGEQKLVKIDDNPGTPQFWKIFASCINKDFNSEFAKISVSKNPYTNQRISNKISLLEELKKRGIWLMDASIVALYNNTFKPSPNMMRKIIETSWDQYVSKVIQEANPKKIIVIGKGIKDILEYKLNKINIPYFVQLQPNARLSKDEIVKSFERYYQLCNN
jgi:soluble P-type ATPase